MISIIKLSIWINRISMLAFVFCLLIGIIDFEFLYYGAYLAFLLGVYQLFSFLITSIYFRNINKQKKKDLLIYILFVIFYFFTCYLIYYKNYNNKFSMIIYFLYIIPVLLSFYWTYIIESLYKQI